MVPFPEGARRGAAPRRPPGAPQVGTYDDDGNGVIDGGEFYRHFVKLGRVERARRAEQTKREAEDRHRRDLQQQSQAMRRFNAKIREVRVVWPEEVQRAGRRGRRSGGDKKVSYADEARASRGSRGHRPKSAPAARPATARPKVVAL